MCSTCRRQPSPMGFTTAVSHLGLADLHFHDLRHTFATRLGAAGLDPFTIAELTGHSDLKMVKRYTHALWRNKQLAVEALVRTPGVERVSQISHSGEENLEKTG
jgi:integrase